MLVLIISLVCHPIVATVYLHGHSASGVLIHNQVADKIELSSCTLAQIGVLLMTVLEFEMSTGNGGCQVWPI